MNSDARYGLVDSYALGRKDDRRLTMHMLLRVVQAHAAKMHLSSGASRSGGVVLDALIARFWILAFC